MFNGCYVLWGAFEHFEVGLSPWVLEAFRILKPGGYLFFSIPFANRRIQRKQEQNFVQLQFNFSHSKFQRFYQWRLTRGELARESTMVGFKPLEIIPIHKDVGIRRMIRNDLGIRWRSGSLAETFSTYVLISIIP
jgi:SAM-dependent methyltransferase